MLTHCQILIEYFVYFRILYFRSFLYLLYSIVFLLIGKSILMYIIVVSFLSTV